jgi:hypothetical protein
VYGERHAFLLAPPAGWVLDTEMDKNGHAHTVLYREGSSWAGGASVMYADTCLKTSDECRTLEAFLTFDSARFREHASGGRVTVAPSLPTGDAGKTAVVRRFTGGGSFEGIAYVDEPTVVVRLVSSARSTTAFEASYGAFERLVGSYSWLGEKVDGPQGPAPAQEAPPPKPAS